MSSSILRWLHLADFHVANENYEQRRLFKKILDHIRIRDQKSEGPDCIIITGDIAYSGKDSEYAIFRRDFFEPLVNDLNKCRVRPIIIVPGNHDLNQDKAKALDPHGIVPKVPTFLEPSDQGLEQRKILLEKFGSFARNDPTCEDCSSHWLFSPLGALTEVHHWKGYKVGILGLNTAWFCVNSKSDPNQITPGKRIVERSLETLATDRPALIIAAGHHPLDWVRGDGDERAVIIKTFVDYRVLYLHGHLHEGDSFQINYGSGSSYAFQTGAVFEPSQENKNLTRLLWYECNLKTGELCIEPLKWTDKHEWIPDLEAFHQDHRKYKTDQFRFRLNREEKVSISVPSNDDNLEASLNLSTDTSPPRSGLSVSDTELISVGPHLRTDTRQSWATVLITKFKEMFRITNFLLMVLVAASLVTGGWFLFPYRSDLIECISKTADMFLMHFGILPNDVNVLITRGKTYSDRGKSNKAEECYKKALVLSKNKGDFGAERRAFTGLGAVYMTQGKYDLAAAQYKSVLVISQKLGDLKSEEDAFICLANVYRRWVPPDSPTIENKKVDSVYEELQDRRAGGTVVTGLGPLYQPWGTYEKAVEYLNKALDISRKRNDLEGEANALNDLGNTYCSWGQYDKAIECLEKAFGVSQKRNDLVGQVNTLTNLGQTYCSMGKYAKAQEYFEKVLESNSQINDANSSSRALIGLGKTFEEQEQYGKAVECYEKALGTSKQRDPKSEASALVGLGNVYSELAHYSKAVECFRAALTIMQRRNSREGEGAVIANLGNVYYTQGQYSQAVTCYEKALAISKELKDLRGEKNALNNLGVVYQDWGQYSKAVRYYEGSIEIAKKLKDFKAESEALNNLGVTYQHWGEYNKALECFKKALDIVRQIGDLKREQTILANLGIIYGLRSNYEQALKCLEIINAKYVSAGISTNWPKQLLGNLYLDMGNIEKAEPLIEESGYRPSLGRLYLEKCDFKNARVLYNTLLRGAEQNRNADSLFTGYTGLGRACEGLEENKNALEHFQIAINLTEELRTSLSQDQRSTFFDVKINGFRRTAPYDGLVRTAAKMKMFGEVFRASEYTKSRMFAEAISSSSQVTSFSIPMDLFQQDQALNDRLQALRRTRQRAYEQSNHEAIATIEPQIVTLEKELAAHVEKLREKYPIFAATKYPQPMIINHTAIRSNEWLLIYQVTDLGTIVSLLHGKQILKTEFTPISRKALEELVLKIRTSLEISPEKPMTEQLESFDISACKTLADYLLKDVIKDLPRGVPVIVIPDGCLGTLPFEMLAIGNNSGRIISSEKGIQITGVEFLGDRNPISYYQSVTVLTLRRTLASNAPKQDGFLVIADPVFSEDDPRVSKTDRQKGNFSVLPDQLMGAKNETKLTFPRLSLTSKLESDLRLMYYNSNYRAYVGLAATKNNLIHEITRSSGTYDKVLFATHGYFGKDLPGIREPFLTLTLVPSVKSGFLSMSEVMGLRFNANIVFLLACRTGLGHQMSGEGTMGMGRAFQYAGAKSVVMSLWDVAESTSVNLALIFFRHLKEGKTKMEALQLARREIRSAGYDHPFFWASFILVGEVD